MNHFRNKRYWILMPPFLIVTLLLFRILPDDMQKYSVLVILPFWVIYYAWNYYAIKKINQNKGQSSP
ncbi:hypothetical protein [Alkalihalobacillus sp. R86527]|uniref:hypothetical protein n=1 Tax=Alkalihalobacillus sp. R86527 TaxID=3093863 RepID=UPI00366D4731